MDKIAGRGHAGRVVVVLTGSESTGKTTLALELAEELGAPVSLEFARSHVDAKRAPLDAGDVEPIALGQLAAEDHALAAVRGAGLVVKDTDLVSTVVYAHHYYSTCPDWVEAAARVRLGDLYLLMAPDVPWQADGLQRDRPELRLELHELFRLRLHSFGARVVEIRGDWEERRRLARAALAEVWPPLSSGPAFPRGL